MSKSIVCCNLTVNGGSITATGGNTDPNGAENSIIYSFGISCDDLTVNGGSITATGGEVTCNANAESNVYSYGICANDVTLKNGTIKATSGDVTYASDGDNQDSVKSKSIGFGCYDLTMESGTITATAGKASTTLQTGGTDDGEYRARSLAIKGDDMAVRSGTVTATSGDSSYGVGGEYEGEQFDYTGCAVSHNFGIYSKDGHVSVTGGKIVGDVGGSGKVNISGGTIEDASTEAEATLTISGGTADFVSVENDSTASISGGTVEELYFSPAATPVLSGGTFESITWGAEDGGDTPNLVNALADGYAYYVKGSGSTTYDTLTTPDGEDWYSTVENVQIRAHVCDFVKNSNTYTCACGRTGSQEKIAYLDASGTTQYRVDYTVLDSAFASKFDNFGLKLSSGWYAVKWDVTLSGVTLEGDVHLILCDNAKLCTAQIYDNGTHDLTVYAQSTGDNMGSLFVGNYTQDINDMNFALILGGDLTVVGGNVVATGVSYGMDADGDLTVLGGSVRGTGNAYGIFVSDAITVSGGVLEGVCNSGVNNDRDSYGICCGNLYVTGGKIIGTSGATQGEYSYSNGIYVSDGMTVSGGIVEGTGGKASGEGGNAFSSGICVTADVTISGGTVTGKSITTDGDATHDSHGFLCDDLTVSGGTITATAGIANATDYSALSCGIYCDDLTVSGGTITATGSKASSALTAPDDESTCVIESTGICCLDTNITGGTVTAKGDTAAYRGDYAIATFSYGMNCDSLYIKGGSLTAKAEQTSAYDSAALYAQGGVTLGSKMKITTPSGGTVKTVTDDHGRFDTVVAQGSTPAEEVVIQKVSTSGGSSSGSSSGTTSTTVKNPDGSTTTTTTNKKTGVVTETTKTATGTTATTVTDKNGNSQTTVTVSSKDAGSGETVTLPVDSVKPASGKNAEEITLEIPKNTSVTVEIPVKNITPGTVVVIVGEDGTETVVSSTGMTENGVTVTLTGNATIKIVENSTAFSDVPANAYYADAVDFAFSRGITGGTDAAHFDPHASCTRAQLVTFLWRAVGQPTVDSTMDFADVDAGAYYCEAVRWAASLGIVGGYGNGLFGSGNVVTREQMAVILYRFAHAVGMDTAQGGMAVREYNDYESISDYAVSAMQWAVNTGILQGNNGNLLPSAPCTRAQIVTMLYRLLCK